MFLKLWGVQPDRLKLLFDHDEDPSNYTIVFQFKKERAALEPADKDRIWALEQTPAGPNSMVWAVAGVEVPLTDMLENVFGDCKVTPQRLQFMKMMKEWDSPPMYSTYCLEDDIDRIRSYLQEDAALIYWHYGKDQFLWMKDRGTGEDDENNFHNELKQLCKHLREGRILSVVVGEPIVIDGKQLHTMDVEFRGLQWYPYLMLRGHGNFADADKLPYFFPSKQTRDRAIKWITKRSRN